MRGSTSVQGSWCQGDECFIPRPRLDEYNGLDGRRVEVIVGGLTLWQSAQLATDTAMQSLLCWDGTSRRGATRPGVALEQTRQKKGATYPEEDAGRARLVVPRCQRRRTLVSREGGPLEMSGPRRVGAASDAESGAVCAVGEVESHLGMQCSKGFRTVPSRTASEPWHSFQVSPAG